MRQTRPRSFVLALTALLTTLSCACIAGGAALFAKQFKENAKDIVYVSDYDLLAIRLNGLYTDRLTSGPAIDCCPAWSPDGTQIVFASMRNSNKDIYVMNADGSDVRRLTHGAAADWKPVWSPDGAHIVFESNRDGNWELYVMNADGSGQTRLTHDPLQDRDPSFGG
jgi:Tol biopolymer transport system component